MKFHIVREGETTKDIMFIYSLSIDELKEYNKHIRDWKKIVPGTKLKIPVITEDIDQDVMEMEPFVEDYYPKKPISVLQKEESEETKINEQENVIKEEKQTVEKNENNNEVENIVEEQKEINETQQENNIHKISNTVREEKKVVEPPKILYQYIPVYYYIPYYVNTQWNKPKKK